MFEIMEKRTLGPGIVLMKVKAPLIAGKAMPGQFIMLRVSEEGERIPLTIADYDRVEGSITIIFQKSVTRPGNRQAGCRGLHKGLCRPLGKPSELDVQGRVLCVGGGVGIAPLFPQIKYLYNQGTDVDVIIGARSSDYLILVDEIRDSSSNIYLATDDGSLGHKGFVTDIVKRLLEDDNRYDLVIAVGPLVMMRAVSSMTKEYNIPTTVSMNPIMVTVRECAVDARITVGGKSACVDGPGLTDIWWTLMRPYDVSKCTGKKKKRQT